MSGVGSPANTYAEVFSLLRTVTATRYVTPLREGGSLPAIVEADDLGTYVLKFHLSLGIACSSLDLTENPLPDPGPWEAIADPERRLRTALDELYDYFRRREGLWANIQRDQDIPHLRDNPDVRKIMRPIAEHWERMHRALVEGWETPESQAHSPLVFGAIGVALDFQSWRTMVRKQGMTDEQAVELMARMVRCAAQS